jgi:hypothetical protein
MLNGEVTFSVVYFLGGRPSCIPEKLFAYGIVHEVADPIANGVHGLLDHGLTFLDFF